jgi:hypothetical protein
VRALFPVLLLFCGGCGDPDADQHPPVLDSGPIVDARTDDVAVGLCKLAAKRDCKVTLKIRNGIQSCVAGEQRCEGGHWGECKQKDDADGDGAAGAAGARSR